MKNNKSKTKIWIAGHNGMVGSAILRNLKRKKLNLLTVSKDKLDLRVQNDVEEWLGKNKPDIIFIAAARVGGILENNNYPADFISENLQIQTNVITSAYKNKVKKIIFLGSACVYPISNKPIKETDLLSGHLEATNRAYSVAKIAGIEMCRFFSEQYGLNYLSVQPNNLYGPNDNFSSKSGHVIPALIKKMYDAKVKNKKTCEIWGSGKPKREFLFVDDLAEALFFILEKYKQLEPINVGSGSEISMKDLAIKIKKIIGFDGELTFNKKYPDGVKRKFLDSSKIKKLGWKPKTSLDKGLKLTVDWFIKNKC
jgi:GDP-L-fucose synthase